ncbi:hypothetical protein HanIR_Chr16g0842461 [Helianthus annuus]|nr:hypothetical protein HanIR_Chr16g0842461 [Helianthus annuus]
MIMGTESSPGIIISMMFPLMKSNGSRCWVPSDSPVSLSNTSITSFGKPEPFASLFSIAVFLSSTIFLTIFIILSLACKQVRLTDYCHDPLRFSTVLFTFVVN